MLKPNRLCGSSLARKKTVKWELERRFPARYTASNSPRRTSLPAVVGGPTFLGRSADGYDFPCALDFAAGQGVPALFGGKLMTPLLAARGKHFAATLGLHA
jgi:hypothetical protein